MSHLQPRVCSSLVHWSAVQEVQDHEVKPRRINRDCTSADVVKQKDVFIKHNVTLEDNPAVITFPKNLLADPGCFQESRA